MTSGQKGSDHVEDPVIELDSRVGSGSHSVEKTTVNMGNLLLEDKNEEGEDLLADLPQNVRLRVEELKKLQEKQAKIEEALEQERKLLELKYEKIYQPLYKERAQIISGEKEVGAVTTEEDTEGNNEKGIPGFWLRALMNHSVVEQVITEKDLPALEYLVDIRSTSHEEDNGFKLEFEFASNGYFENKVLTKEYHVTEARNSGDAMLRNVVGTDIKWKPSKNLCEITKKVKQRSKKGKETRIITKTEPCSKSFFHIFSPVEIPTEDMEEESEETMRQLDIDFQVGFTIHESIVPQAVLWFTGEAEEDDDSDYHSEEDEDYDDEEEIEDSDSDEEQTKPKGKKRFPTLDANNTGKDNTEKPPECKNQ